MVNTPRSKCRVLYNQLSIISIYKGGLSFREKQSAQGVMPHSRKTVSETFETCSRKVVSEQFEKSCFPKRIIQCEVFA